MKKFRAAIIGTGNIAGLNACPDNREKISTHAAAYYKNKSIDLVAAFDTDKTRLLKFSKVWKIKNLFISIDDLLNSEKFDVVSLCTSSVGHYEQIKRIITSRNRPLILFIEKPVCLSRKEIE